MCSAGTGSTSERTGHAITWPTGWLRGLCRRGHPDAHGRPDLACRQGSGCWLTACRLARTRQARRHTQCAPTRPGDRSRSMNTRSETIGTRIGPIEVENGYPSQSAAKALYDELDFQRASQAYLWALPAVGFHGLHLAHLRTFGAQDGDVVLYQTLKDKARI